MNRKQRRAEEAARRKCADRAAMINSALDYLANIAAPTATGLTLILPSGEVIYLDAESARTMASTAPVDGRDAS